MAHTKESLEGHPGLNPAYRHGAKRPKANRNPDPLGKPDWVYGPRPASRWMPHQSARECARRLDQRGQ